MSKPAFTSGPFKPVMLHSRKMNITKHRDDSYRSLIVGKGDGTIIAEVRGATETECVAHTHLFAAGPEMVDALQLLINARKSNTLHMEAHWLPAIAALAKALGE